MKRFIGLAGSFLASILVLTACKRGMTGGPQAAAPPPPANFSLVAAISSSGNGIALDTEDNLYVIENTRDSFNYGNILDQRIVKYSRDLNRVMSFGGRGDVDVLAHRSDPDQAPGKFMGLVDLAVDLCGNIYTVESGTFTCYTCPGNLSWSNARVQKFDSNGAYLSQFWADPTAGAAAKAQGTLSGSNNAEINRFFKGARFVETNADGYVVVAVDPRDNGNPQSPNILVLDMNQPSAIVTGTTGTQIIPGLLYVQSSNVLVQSSSGFAFVPDLPASSAYSGGAIYGTIAPASPADQPVSLLKLRLDPWGRPPTGLALTSSAVTGFTSSNWPVGGAAPWGTQLGDIASCGGSQNYNLATSHYVVAGKEPPVAGHLYSGNAGAATGFVGSVSRQGPGLGELSSPQDPRFDSRGYLYLPDPTRDVVNIYRPTKPL